MSYSTGKIYKIVSKQTDKIYIGSTRQTLKERFKVHKAHYKVYIETNKIKCTSIELFKYGDCEIVLIELFPCLSKLGLERREGEIQLENINIIVNRCIARRTWKEWYLDNQDKISENKAQYYLDNKDNKAQYYLDNKDNKAQYYLDNKDKIAQRNLDNKDKIVKKRAQYYLDNKDKIAKKRAQYYLDKNNKNQ